MSVNSLCRCAHRIKVQCLCYTWPHSIWVQTKTRYIFTLTLLNLKWVCINTTNPKSGCLSCLFGLSLSLCVWLCSHFSVSGDLRLPEESSADWWSHSEAPRAAAQNYLRHAGTVIQQRLSYRLEGQFRRLISPNLVGLVSIYSIHKNFKPRGHQPAKKKGCVSSWCFYEMLTWTTTVYFSPPASTGSAPQHQTKSCWKI